MIVRAASGRPKAILRSPREMELMSQAGAVVASVLKRVAEMVQPGQKITLIVDDNTRITPTERIVPIVLDALNQAGIPDNDIHAVIASGTHRPMTAKEKIDKYGEALMSRIRFLDHGYKDPAKLVDYGTTERGTRILVNRDVVEADFRMAIGNIILGLMVWIINL